MSHLPRKEAQDLLRSLGATAENSVTKKTDLLILGSDAGRVKSTQAQKYGIPVMPWEMFVALGLTEPRGRPRTHIDNTLISELTIHLAVTANAIFAYHATRGRDERSLRAFKLAAGCLELFLRGVWSPASDGDPGDAGDPVSDLDSPGECLALAAHGLQLAARCLATKDQR